ncbi:hypothetical protein [Mameliella sp. MMSF_3552]|nr:hypothetical protein [Mameliella sp. MMSF_3552]
MKLKMLFAATALIVAPALAMACPGHSKQAMSCADGMTYDHESNSCVVVAS